MSIRVRSREELEALLQIALLYQVASGLFPTLPKPQPIRHNHFFQNRRSATSMRQSASKKKA